MLIPVLAFAMRMPLDQPCDVRVHVVDARTAKPLPKIAVNLRLDSGSRSRTTIQHETDSSGTACFAAPQPLPSFTSVDAFSIHYHEIEADPLIKSLPQDVTIRLRRLNFLQSLHYALLGD
jgi:hypothetical protein